MAAIAGINVSAPVVPNTTEDIYASHLAKYGQGGLRTVQTIAERDAIPALRKEVGMLVFCVQDGHYYQLNTNLTSYKDLGTNLGSDPNTGQEITALKQDVAQLKVDVLSSDADIADLQAQSATLSTTVEGQGSQITALQSTSSAHTQAIAGLEATSSDTQQRVSSLEDISQAHATEIINLQETTEATTAQVTDLTSAVQTQAAQLAQTRSDVQANAQSITNVTSSLVSTQDDVSQIQSEQVIQNTRLTNVEQATTQVTGDVATLSTQVGQLTPVVQTHTTEITALQTGQTQLQTNVSALTSSVTVIEGDVESLQETDIATASALTQLTTTTIELRQDQQEEENSREAYQAVIAGPTGASKVGISADGTTLSNLELTALTTPNAGLFGASPSQSDNSTALLKLIRYAQSLKYDHSADLTVRVPQDYPTINAAIESLNAKAIPSDVTLRIEVTGHHSYATQVALWGVTAQTQIVGTGKFDVPLDSIASITGTAGNYSVTYNTTDSTANVDIGDVLIVRGDEAVLANNPFAYRFHGGWEITAKTASTITVKCTHRRLSLATSPTTNGVGTVLKTVIKFTDTLGFVQRPSSASAFIDSIAILGVAGPLNRADYGVVSGSFGLAGSEPWRIRPASAAMLLGRDVVVSGWRRTGVWSGYGGAIFCEGGSASCNNGEHGYEADSGGFMSLGWYRKQTIANGNVGHGILAYNGGAIWGGAFIVAEGNGFGGIAAVCSSAIVIGSQGASANYNTHGLMAEQASAVESTATTAVFDFSNNTTQGVRSTFNSSVIIPYALVRNNGLGNSVAADGKGLYAYNGGNIYAANSQITGSTGHGVHSYENSTITVVSSSIHDNGGYGVLAEMSGACVRATGASSYANAGGQDFAAQYGGVVYARNTYGIDAATGARYYASYSGEIDAMGSQATGGVFSPPAGVRGPFAGLIRLTSGPDKASISRRVSNLASGVNTYAPSIEAGLAFTVVFSGATTFALEAPTNTFALSHDLTLLIKNGNSSTAVTPTFATNYAGVTPVSIGVGNSSLFRFYSDDGVRYYLIGATQNVAPLP